MLSLCFHTHVCSFFSFLRLLRHGCEDAAVFSFLQTLQRALQEQGGPISSRWENSYCPLDKHLYSNFFTFCHVNHNTFLFEVAFLKPNVTLQRREKKDNNTETNHKMINK